MTRGKRASGITSSCVPANGTKRKLTPLNEGQTMTRGDRVNTCVGGRIRWDYGKGQESC